MTRFHLFLDNIKSVPVYLLKLNGHLVFTSYQIISLQMAERLRRVQPVSVANHVKACRSLIERSVTWLATESGWARSKHSAICSGKLCGGFIIIEQCCRCALYRCHIVEGGIVCIVLFCFPPAPLKFQSAVTHCQSKRLLENHTVISTPNGKHEVHFNQLSWPLEVNTVGNSAWMASTVLRNSYVICTTHVVWRNSLHSLGRTNVVGR